MAQPGEPSVGEILESIKKVIAREDRAVGTPAPPAPDRGDSLADDEEAPVLELTAAEMEPAFAAAASGPAPGGVPGHERPPPGSASVPPAPPLPTEAARASLHDLLASLAALADPAPACGVAPGETSLEALARDLMRPAIAEWLDRNLAPLAEKLVAAEIARLRDGHG